MIMKKKSSSGHLFIPVLAFLFFLISSCGSMAKNPADTASSEKNESADTTKAASSSEEKAIALQDCRIKVTRIRHDERIQTILYTDNGDPVIELGAGSDETSILYDPGYFELLSMDGTPVPFAEGGTIALNRHIKNNS